LFYPVLSEMFTFSAESDYRYSDVYRYTYLLCNAFLVT